MLVTSNKIIIYRLIGFYRLVYFLSYITGIFVQTKLQFKAIFLRISMNIGSGSIEVRETNHLIQTATNYTNDKK